VEQQVLGEHQRHRGISGADRLHEPARRRQAGAGATVADRRGQGEGAERGPPSAHEQAEPMAQRS